MCYSGTNRTRNLFKNHCTASLPFFKDAEIKLPHWIGSSKSMIININDTYEYYHNSSSDYETET